MLFRLQPCCRQWERSLSSHALAFRFLAASASVALALALARFNVLLLFVRLLRILVALSSHCTVLFALPPHLCLFKLTKLWHVSVR